MTPAAFTYRRLRISGVDNLCGVFAVVGSLDAQVGLQATAHHARDIVRGDEFQERLGPFSFLLSANNVDEDTPNFRPGPSTQESADATSNLPVDKVALLLDMIGEESGRTFQLGVTTPTSRHVYYRRDGICSRGKAHSQPTGSAIVWLLTTVSAVGTLRC